MSAYIKTGCSGLTFVRIYHTGRCLSSGNYPFVTKSLTSVQESRLGHQITTSAWTGANLTWLGSGRRKEDEVYTKVNIRIDMNSTGSVRSRENHLYRTSHRNHRALCGPPCPLRSMTQRPTENQSPGQCSESQMSSTEKTTPVDLTPEPPCSLWTSVSLEKHNTEITRSFGICHGARKRFSAARTPAPISNLNPHSASAISRAESIVIMSNSS